MTLVYGGALGPRQDTFLNRRKRKLEHGIRLQRILVPDLIVRTKTLGGNRLISLEVVLLLLLTILYHPYEVVAL